MKAVKKYNKGGKGPGKKSKAQLAAEAAKKRELQDKFRKADKDLTRDAKDAAESKSKSKKKATGKGLSKDQKERTVGRIKKNPTLRPKQIKENIKSDLRNVQSGKEELAYVGRPDRYGSEYATIKDKMYNTSKNKDGSYNRTRVKNIYNDFEGQAPKGAKLKPVKKRKR